MPRITIGIRMLVFALVLFLSFMSYATIPTLSMSQAATLTSPLPRLPAGQHWWMPLPKVWLDQLNSNHSAPVKAFAAHQNTSAGQQGYQSIMDQATLSAGSVTTLQDGFAETLPVAMPETYGFSVPFTLDNPSFSSIFGSSYLQNYVGAFLTYTQGQWIQVMDSNQGQYLTPMSGLYLIENTNTPTPTATFIATTQTVAPPTPQLYTGWNLVGPSMGSNPVAASPLLAGSGTYQDFVSGSQPYNAVMAIGDATQLSNNYEPYTDTSDIVENGLAYWVYVASDGTLRGQCLTGGSQVPLTNEKVTQYSPTIYDPFWGFDVPQFSLDQQDTASLTASSTSYQINVTWTCDDGLIYDYANYPWSQSITIQSANYNEDRSTGQISDWPYGDYDLSPPPPTLYSNNDKEWTGGQSSYSFNMSAQYNDEQDITIWWQNSDGVFLYENGAMWVYTPQSGVYGAQ